MKRTLTTTLSAALIIVVSSSVALGKHSAAHKAAKQRCNQEYKAQLKSAKKHKHGERKRLEAEIKKAHKDCLAQLPR